MFCVNCGKAYEPFHKFCNHCGYPLPSFGGPQQAGGAPAPPDVVAEREVPVSLDAEASPIPVTPTPLVVNPPYSVFVTLMIGSVLLTSMLVFKVAQTLVRNRWGNTVLAVAVTVGAVLLGRTATTAWRRVVAAESETDAMLNRRHRRVLRNSAIISLLFFTSAAIIGAAIGKSRDEAIQLAADLGRMNTVGTRISTARSRVGATITSYVEMYKTISPDVHDLEATLGRLKAELVVYDSKFPAQHAQTSKSIADIETGLRRMALLRRQIVVAKEIEPLDPSQQVAAWKTKMLPLLTDEDALDKTR